MTAITATITPPTKGSRCSIPLRKTLLRAVEGESARRAWADYVEGSPGGTPFHHPDWCDAVAHVFGHGHQHCLAWSGEHVIGVLPLMEVRSILAGRLLVSVPYATYGGALADDDSTTLALVTEAQRLADSRGARMLELRSRQAAVAGLPVDDRYAAFVRRLPLRIDELATFLPRKARAATRQAQSRDGLVARHDAALLTEVWQLYARSMRRLGSINYPLRFFEALAAAFGSRTWVTVVCHEQRPIAGLLSFVFRETVYPYFVGVDERVRGTGATNLLYFAVMERAVRAGLQWFDFGRSRRDNPGPFSFKRNQGFEPTTLGYQRYAPAGQTLPDLTPNNPRFSPARRVWPRLPLALTKSLGAWLSKSIPG